MEVMTDILVGWVQMSQYPSCFVSKAGRGQDRRRADSKIVGHHEVRLRGLGRRTNAGAGFRQRSVFCRSISQYPIRRDRSRMALVAQLYGPAVRCKLNVNKWRGWSCASVSGPWMERMCFWPSWITARSPSHSGKALERPLGSLPTESVRPEARVIRKSGYRFSEKVMLKQKHGAGRRFEDKSSRSSETAHASALSSAWSNSSSI